MNLCRIGRNINELLADAVIQNDRPNVRKLLLDGANPAYYCRREGTDATLLHFVKSGEVANDLLNFGASVNAINKWGTTPLFPAIAQKRLDVVQVLLDHGAFVREVRHGETALNYAIQYYNGTLNIIRELIKHGVELDQLDPFNVSCTPAIHSATLFNHLDVIDELMELGANIDVLNKTDQSALHVALESPSTELTTIRKLLECGANVELRYLDRSPLDIAVLLRDTSIVLELLKHEASTTSIDNNGESSLYKFISRSDPVRIDVVQALLNYGADAGIVTSWRMNIKSPIFYALAKYKNCAFPPTWVMLLLKYSILQHIENYVHVLDPNDCDFYFGKCSEAFRCCMYEIGDMKKVMIDDSVSLYHFARLHNRACFHHLLVKEITVKSFNELVSNRFPMYNDILLPRLHRGYLIAKLVEQKIFTLRKDLNMKQKECILVPDAKLAIAKHLSNIEVFYLTMAFYQPDLK